MIRVRENSSNSQNKTISRKKATNFKYLKLSGGLINLLHCSTYAGLPNFLNLFFLLFKLSFLHSKKRKKKKNSTFGTKVPKNTPCSSKISSPISIPISPRNSNAMHQLRSELSSDENTPRNTPASDMNRGERETRADMQFLMDLVSRIVSRSRRPS